MKQLFFKTKRWLQNSWEFLERENLTYLIRLLFILGIFVLILSISAYLFEYNNLKNLNPSDQKTSIRNPFDAIWWIIITATTVGYGDIFPKTSAGRFIAVCIIFSGPIYLSLIKDLIVNSLSLKKIKEELGLSYFRFEKHIIICEWNYRAEQIIQELRKNNKTKNTPIILIADIERIPIESEKLFFVKGSVNEKTLHQANLEKAKTVIILGDDNIDYEYRDAKVILSTLTIEKMNKDAYSIVELLNEAYIPTCKQADADEIIISSNLNCNLIVSAAINHGISSVVTDILNYGDGNQLYKRCLPHGKAGDCFLDVFTYMKKHEQSIIIAIQNDEIGVMSNPPSDYKLQEKDYLIVIAHHSQYSPY